MRFWLENRVNWKNENWYTNAAQPRECIPQGLKPAIPRKFHGTDKSVPFQETI